MVRLVSIGLGKTGDVELPADFNWKETYDLAMRQGVAALAGDGVQAVYAARPDIQKEMPDLKLLKGNLLRECILLEQEYDEYLKTVGKLAKFYADQGIPMMLLKGYGLSLDWPIPAHRPMGDIDIYLWDRWEEADRKVAEVLKKEVSNRHHHHSTFTFRGKLVENHYDFVNAYSNRSSKRIEATFKELAGSGAVTHVLPNGVQVFLPSADLHALFVTRHCGLHFSSTHMTLRQLLDWALFVERHHGEISWPFFWDQCRAMGMEKFVLCLDAIAVGRFGFDPQIFHTPDGSVVDAALADRVFAEILNPEFDEKAGGHGAVHYMWVRLKCWNRSTWKRRLVFSDSQCSTFLSQIRAHLMKPAHIVGK